MQRGERQVARLGDPQRRFDRLEVAHLADEDDVGVLAERGAQRVGEALRVAVHLALVHEAALVLVDVLDRILDGEDVLVALGVDLVDHRRERRRLAAAGRAGDEHEAARPVGQRGEHRRQAQLAEGADLLGNQPGRPAPTAPRWLKTLQRKRARPRMPNEKSSSSVSSKRFFCASVRTL